MINLQNLPTLNAGLNALATILLLSGYYFIKKGQVQNHIRCMIMALVVSALFLGSYLTYHFNFPSKKFPDLGLIKTIYLCILIPHIILAAGMLPLIFKTIYHAFKDQKDRHKKWAKITLPIWLYVSITGVIIYCMLYVWY